MPDFASLDKAVDIWSVRAERDKNRENLIAEGRAKSADFVADGVKSGVKRWQEKAKGRMKERRWGGTRVDT